MKGPFLLTASVIFIFLLADGRGSLDKLSSGMDRGTVYKIMGEVPLRTETLEGERGKLEVLYFYTGTKEAKGAIADRDMTPLVFTHGELTNWGWIFLKDQAVKYGIKL